MPRNAFADMAILILTAPISMALSPCPGESPGGLEVEHDNGIG